jgi:hypothetical protein
MAITRKKTDEIRKSVCTNGTEIDCVVWAILDDGETVGEACATYKTPTQRTFDAHMTIDGLRVEVEGIRSIAKCVRALQDRLTAAQAEAADNDSADEGTNLEIVETESETA